MVRWIEWAVSYVPDPAITAARSPTAWATARHRSTFSWSESVAPSPVEPAITRPSLPWSSSQAASSCARSRSRVRSSLNGVAMAVMTEPNLALTVVDLLADRSTGRARRYTRPRRRARIGPPATARA